MTYAKLEDNQLILATPEDDITTGDWKELVLTDKPQDTVRFYYTERYDLISEELGGEYKIVQSWNQNLIEPKGRVAKLQGNQLVFPSQTEVLPDGTVICNFDRLPNSRKLDCGYMLVKETGCPQDGKQYRETGILVDDPDYGKKIEIVWVEVAPVPEQPFNISKIKLRHSLKEIGLWDTFYNMLKNAEGDLLGEWTDAVVLTSNDPMVLGFAHQLTGPGIMNIAQVKNLLETCKSDIQ